jgi:hypothetical protein
MQTRTLGQRIDPIALLYIARHNKCLDELRLLESMVTTNAESEIEKILAIQAKLMQLSQIRQEAKNPPRYETDKIEFSSGITKVRLICKKVLISHLEEIKGCTYKK